MKAANKLISLLLTITLLFTAYPAKIYAANPSTTARDWYYTKSKNHKTPIVSAKVTDMLQKYDAVFLMF